MTFDTDVATEARCRNAHTSKREFIRWTSRQNIRSTGKNVADIPPLLWAFPGSNAAWVRLLIEYSTGYYSGSVNREKDVETILPGEAHGCDRGVICIYADAQENKVARLMNSPISYICNTKVSNLMEPFQKVVVLIRNPYDCIWQAYMRALLRKRAGKRIAGQSPPISAKRGMIRRSEFEHIEWRQRALTMANEWVIFVNGAGKWERKLPHSTLIIRVEQLFSVSSMKQIRSVGSVDHQPWLRCVALGRLLAFLGYGMNTPTLSKIDSTALLTDTRDIGSKFTKRMPAQISNSVSSGERCTCAFVLAAAANWDAVSTEQPPRQPSLHSLSKSKTPALSENRDSHAKSVDYSLNSVEKELPEYIRDNFLGRENVYQNDPRLVCDMWSILKGKAAKFGYRPYGDTRCFYS